MNKTEPKIKSLFHLPLRKNYFNFQAHKRTPTFNHFVCTRGTKWITFKSLTHQPQSFIKYIFAMVVKSPWKKSACVLIFFSYFFAHRKSERTGRLCWQYKEWKQRRRRRPTTAACIFCVEQQIISHLHKHLVAKNDVFFCALRFGCFGIFPAVNDAPMFYLYRWGTP